MSTQSSDPIDGPARALYDATYFGRGLNTTHLAGRFAYAADCHSAAYILGRMIAKEAAGSPRHSILSVVRGLVITERNSTLDEVAKQWASEGSAMLDGQS